MATNFSYLDNAAPHIINALNRLYWEQVDMGGEMIYMDLENIHNNVLGIAAIQLAKIKMNYSNRDACAYAIKADKELNGNTKLTGVLLDQQLGADCDDLYKLAFLVHKAYGGKDINAVTIDDIKPTSIVKERTEILSKRFKQMFQENNPVEFGHRLIGFYGDYLPDGYIDCVDKNSILSIDMGISRGVPTKPERLRLLAWYAMSLAACDKITDNIEYLGIYKPRSNTIFRLPIEKIPDNLVQDVVFDILRPEGIEI